MITERISVTTDWSGPAIRTKVYEHQIDERGKKYVEYTQYFYIPYSERGVEIKDQPNGQHIDVRV